MSVATKKKKVKRKRKGQKSKALTLDEVRFTSW